MEDSLSPSILWDLQPSHASTITHIPLTLYSTRTCAQSLVSDLNKPTNSIFTLPDRLSFSDNLHPPLQSTTIPLQTMQNEISTIPQDFSIINGPSPQAQVLVPNPLLSDSTRPDRCMPIGKQCLEPSSLPSPTSIYNYSPFDENQVPKLARPPDPEQITVPSRFLPVNVSALGFNSISVLNASSVPQVLATDPTKSLSGSIDDPTPGTDLLLRSNSSFMHTTNDEVTQPNLHRFSTQDSKSPSSTNVSPGSGNARSLPQIQSGNSLITALVPTDADNQIEKKQTTTSRCTSSEIHGHENGGRGDWYGYVPILSFKVDESGSIDSSPVPKEPFEEIVISGHQGDLSRGATDFSSLNLVEERDMTKPRKMLQLRDGFEHCEKVPNTGFGISSSEQNNVESVEEFLSPVLQKECVAEGLFQDRIQRDELFTTPVEVFRPSRKRRRLDSSAEEQCKFQPDGGTNCFAKPSFHHKRLCPGELGDRKEMCNHEFTEQRYADLSNEFQAYDQLSYQRQDEPRVYGRQSLEMCPEYTELTKERREGGNIGVNCVNTFGRNENELLNEQERAGLDNFKNQEGNDTACDQEELLSSETDGSESPSHTVRAVEQKDGYSYMVLEVYKPAVCPSCNKRFPTKELLDYHVGKKHGQSTRRRYRKRKRQPKAYRCTVCNLRLANDANLRRHYRIVHEGKTIEICGLCDANFNSHHGLVLHRRDLHGIIPDSVQEKEGRSRKKRHYRKKKSSNIVPKPVWVVWKCGNCSFFSGNKGNMTRHINIVHLKIADHLCEECSEVFKTKHNLQVHLMNRHPKSGKSH